MTLQTRHRYSKQEPLEDRFSPKAWRQYQLGHIVTKALTRDVKIRARWIIMKIRQDLTEGSHLSIADMEGDLHDYEGGTDSLFSDTSANKAKLRVGKYTVSFCLARVRDEISWFIATGQQLKHKKHLTQDTA